MEVKESIIYQKKGVCKPLTFTDDVQEAGN